MGCISSKEEDRPPAAAAATTDAPSPLPRRGGGGFDRSEEKPEEGRGGAWELRRSRKESSQGRGGSSSSFGVRIGFSHRYVDAEQVSAGWPPWLTAAAAEAIHGWVPLRADSFAKLEKVRGRF